MTQRFDIGTDGKPIGSSTDSVTAPAVVTTPVTNAITSSTMSITGMNLGIGNGIFAGSNGGKDVLLDFRTIVAGNGIQIDTDATTLTITNTGTLESNLNNLAGALGVAKGGTGATSLPGHALLLGNGTNPIQSISLPTSANTVLTWDGSNYVWGNGSGSGGGISSIAINAASSKLTINGSPLTGVGVIAMDVNESAIAINNLNGTLSVAKGGTGTTSLTHGGVMIGGLAVTSTSAPTGANQMLVWDGAAFTWKIGGTVTSVSIISASSKLSIVGSTITDSGSFVLDINESSLNLSNIGGITPVAKGGTGLTALGSNKQVLRVNSSTNSLEYVTLSIADIAGLSAVAGSGQYADLIGKPNLSTLAATGSYNDLLNKPSLSTIATTGNYNDLIGKPVLSTLAVSGQYADLSGKPNFSIVATSGNYTDLNGKPIFANVATSGQYIDLAGRPGLSAVATSGGYDDLIGKPTLSTIAITGQYGDLLNKPNLSDLAMSGHYDDLSGTPSLSSVAVSGDYTDLVNTPILSSVATSGSYNDLLDKPVITTGTVTSVGITPGSNKLSVDSNSITTSGTLGIDINEANLSLNNQSGTLLVSKGGTGLSVISENSILVGGANNTISLVNVPTIDNSVLTWSNNALVWAVPGNASVSYVADTNTNYLQGATSLANADVILDSRIKTISDAYQLSDTALHQTIISEQATALNALTTSTVSEGDKLFYTDARARLALSIQPVAGIDDVKLAYDNALGVFSLVNAVAQKDVAGAIVTANTYTNNAIKHMAKAAYCEFLYTDPVKTIATDIQGRVHRIKIILDNGFNGENVTIAIGIDALPENNLLNTYTLDYSSENIFTLDMSAIYDTASEVKIFIDSTNSTVGKGAVIIEYFTP